MLSVGGITWFPNSLEIIFFLWSLHHASQRGMCNVHITLKIVNTHLALPAEVTSLSVDTCAQESFEDPQEAPDWEPSL